MTEPEILTDPHQMLLRALAAKDADVEELHEKLGRLRVALEVLALYASIEGDRAYARHALEQSNGSTAKDAEIERLKGVESWLTEAVDELHAEITTLEWKLSETEKEIERLGRSTKLR